MIAVRGAARVKSNTPEDIHDSSERLIRKIIETNHITEENIIYILFSTTPDLDSAYPATAVRKRIGWSVPMMGSIEQPVKPFEEKTLRVMLVINGVDHNGMTNIKPKGLKHIYLDDTGQLFS